MSSFNDVCKTIKQVLADVKLFAEIDADKAKMVVKKAAQELKIEYKNDRNNTSGSIDN